MAKEIKMYQIITNALSSILPKQIGNENVADSELGFKMWGGKDEEGNITRFLAKDKPAKTTSLTVANSSQDEIDAPLVDGARLVSKDYSGDGTSSLYVKNENASEETPICVQGEFEGILNGVSPLVTGIIKWQRTGNIVSLYIPNMAGVGDGTNACSITGMPDNDGIRPISDDMSSTHFDVRVGSNSALGRATIKTNGVIQLEVGRVAVTNQILFLSTDFPLNDTKGIFIPVFLQYHL